MKEKLLRRARQLKTDIPAVYLALRKPETPLSAKLLAAVTVCLALSPIDLIPDFIPVVGWLDDLILLPILIGWTVKLIPPDILAQCRRKSAEIWSEGKPKKWYFGLPIVFFWGAVILLILKIWM